MLGEREALLLATKNHGGGAKCLSNDRVPRSNTLANADARGARDTRPTRRMTARNPFDDLGS